MLQPYGSTVGHMRKVTFGILSIAIAGMFLNAHAATPAVPQAEPVVLADADQASYNWAGYVADSATEYTAVSASWIVPDVTGEESSDLSADATWVGIGGVQTRDLIQAGTQALVQDGQVVYQAWWEALPGVSQPLTVRVSPGDSVTAAITYIGQSQWNIAVINNTTGKRAQITVAYNSSFSSAEWVEEAPSLAAGHRRPLIPLTHFGTVVFSGASTVADGKALSLSAAGAEPLRMVQRNGTTLAMPSVVSTSGGGFSVVETDVARSDEGAAPRAAVVLFRSAF